ncbi:MAG: MATE family efflux transporter [Bacteroidota bacterium]
MKKLQHIGQNFQQWFRASGGYFVDQAMVSGGNFALTLVLARQLGVEGFGLFSLGWMGVLFVNSLQQAFVLTPMLSLHATADKGYLNALARIQALLAFAPVVLVLPALPFFPEADHRLLLLAVAVASFGHQLYDFSRKALLVRSALRPVQLLDAAVLLSQLALVGGLHFAGILTPITVLFGLGMAFTLCAALPFFQLLQTCPATDMKALVGRHWNYGRWLGATALLQWFSGNFFILTGGALLGTAAMGAIRMAQTLTGLLNVLLLAFENFVPVRAANVMAADGFPAMRRYLGQMSWKGAALFLPVLALTALFAQPIVSLAFGAEYLPFAYVLRGFCLLYALVFVGTMLRYFYRTTGDTREIFFAYVISTVVSLFLATPVVSSMGLIGIVAGLLLSQILICGWLYLRIPTLHIAQTA